MSDPTGLQDVSLRLRDEYREEYREEPPPAPRPRDRALSWLPLVPVAVLLAAAVAYPFVFDGFGTRQLRADLKAANERLAQAETRQEGADRSLESVTAELAKARKEAKAATTTASQADSTASGLKEKIRDLDARLVKADGELAKAQKAIKEGQSKNEATLASLDELKMSITSARAQLATLKTDLEKVTVKMVEADNYWVEGVARFPLEGKSITVHHRLFETKELVPLAGDTTWVVGGKEQDSPPAKLKEKTELSVRVLVRNGKAAKVELGPKADEKKEK